MAERKEPRSGIATVQGSKNTQTRRSHYSPDTLEGQEPSLTVDAPITDNSAASQRARILQHLLEVGSLTTLQARHQLDTLHPAQRVLELRKDGHPIESVWCQDVTPEGNLHRVAKYFLAKKKQLALFGRPTLEEVQG